MWLLYPSMLPVNGAEIMYWENVVIIEFTSFRETFWYPCGMLLIKFLLGNFSSSNIKTA